MAKKNNEVTENEVITSTGETTEDIKGKSMLNPENENTPVAKEEKAKAVEAFNDKYTDTKYVEGTEFIIVDEDIETIKLGEKQYKISKKRAEEIKTRGFIK